MLANTASPLVGVSPKQISAFSSGTAGMVFYTVPANRKFVGYVTISAPTGSGAGFTVNGVNHMIAMINSSGGCIVMSNQLVFLGGTTLATSASSSTSIIGIESDV